MPGSRIARDDEVTLRTCEREDVSFLQRAHANPELRRPTGLPLENQEGIESRLGETDQFIACLEPEALGPGDPTVDDVERIGHVELDTRPYRRPELGFWLEPDVHGQGYGTRTVSLAVDYAFELYDTPGLYAEVYDYNEASQGLLESLGFEQEGRLRKSKHRDGEYVDRVLYGLLREEWSSTE
jgi:ribosomal-protein-alanine N-acetyltransferase